MVMSEELIIICFLLGFLVKPNSNSCFYGIIAAFIMDAVLGSKE